MAAVSNTITNAQRRETCPAGVTVVGLVGVDSVLVSADEPISRHGLIDVAGSEDGAAHDAAGLIHRDMRLVAEEVLALLLRPRRIGVKRAAHQLAAWAPVGIGRQRGGRGSRRIDR